jgi:hypothetical protein
VSAYSLQQLHFGSFHNHITNDCALGELPCTGYVDEPGFNAMMRGFQDQCGPLRPQFVFLDGYDAHFSAVLSELKKNGIYVFFLRSNNSINDQPNDNGINAMFEHAFNRAVAQLRLSRPGLPMTPALVNQCLMEAWRYCKCNGGPTIVKSFGSEGTGICPVDRRAKNHVVNAKLATAFPSQLSKAAAASAAASKGNAAAARAVSWNRTLTVFNEPHVVMR